MKEDALEKLGFSEYEKRVYLALLKKNPIGGYELARVSGVPRSRVYETLEKLEARGVVLVSHQRPTLYRPISPRELAERLRNDFEKAVGWLEENAEALQEEEMFSSIWSLEGREAVLSRARSMTESAKKSIYLASGESVLREMKSSLKKAVARNARLVVVACGPFSLEGAHVFPHESCFTEDETFIILITDGKDVLLGDTMPTDSCRAAWSQNPGIVYVAEDYIRHEVHLQLLKRLFKEETTIFEQAKQEMQKLIPLHR